MYKYKYIISPNSGKRYSISSNKGKNILKNYLNVLVGSGSKASSESLPESEFIYESYCNEEDYNDQIITSIIHFINRAKNSTVNFKTDCSSEACDKQNDAIYNNKSGDYDLVSAEEFENFVSYLSIKDKLFLESKSNDDNSYVMCKNIYLGKKIIFMGDFHSNLHAFIQNLESLQSVGIIDIDFVINPDYMLIFTGDIIDRGPYGIEILYLLYLLIL